MTHTPTLSAERRPTSIGHYWEIMPIGLFKYVDYDRIPHDLTNTRSVEAEAIINSVVEACNSHAALKKSHKEILSLLKYARKYGHGGDSLFDENADKAISAAESLEVKP